MDELIDMDSEFEPTMENYQDSLFVAGRFEMKVFILTICLN